MKKITTMLLVTALLVISVRGQGFLNLDFSLAHNLPSNPGINGLPVSATNALPGWTAYDGKNTLSSITYLSNSFSGFSTAVQLEGGTLALGGNNFGVGLFGGSISQTAQVPNNAESLEFETPSDLNLRVDLGGERLLLSEISANSNYNVYGANLPAGLAGQVETLTFYEDGSATVLDGIVFSSSPIPEPGEGALLGLGALVWAVYWRRSRTERRKY
jgi:hypothetical protein